MKRSHLIAALLSALLLLCASPALAQLDALKIDPAGTGGSDGRPRLESTENPRGRAVGILPAPGATG